MKPLDVIRDELAEPYGDSADNGDKSQQTVFHEGFDAAIQALTEASGEFDLVSVDDAAILQGRFTTLVKSGAIKPDTSDFREGARWQFEADRARIGLAEAMKGEYLLRMQDYAESVTVFADKCKHLEARLAESERLLNDSRRRESKCIDRENKLLLELYASEARCKELETQLNTTGKPE